MALSNLHPGHCAVHACVEPNSRNSRAFESSHFGMLSPQPQGTDMLCA